MYLIHMRPEQIQDAVRRNVPVVMPAGCIEYHGSHLPVDTDFLIASSVCCVCCCSCFTFNIAVVRLIVLCIRSRQ